MTMYRYGKADTALPMADGSGYRVMIWVDGKYVPMTSLVNGEWQVCIFPTLRQADMAMSNYNEFSWVD